MNLICSSCGGNAPARHQWHNRDTGYGVCPGCFEAAIKKDGIEQAIHLYGAPGIHHSIKPRPVAEMPKSISAPPLKTVQRLRQAESL